jgi:hypothetical protein
MSKKSLNALAAGQAPAPDTKPAVEHVFDFFRLKLDSESRVKDVVILQTGFIALLRRMGFHRYDIQESFIIVRIKDNIIEQIHLHQLRSIVMRYMYSLPDEPFEMEGCPKALLVEKMHRSLSNLTSEVVMGLLVDMQGTENDIELVSDSIDKAYYFYKNGFIECSKSGWKLRPYAELPGYVWKDQIIQREFKKVDFEEIEKCPYWDFLNNVADNYLDAKEKRNNPSRFASLLTITGYNLHRYFETKLRCSVFLDARQSEDPDGRSGKSLHTKAMRHVMNANPETGQQLVTIDGKEFNPENRFKYDDLHVSTKLVVIDDVKRGLDITQFFNAVVDGFVQELKGKERKRRILAKLILTLNYTLQIRGGSAKDRVIEFEFADFYSNTKTPEMVHGHWFFRDWDADVWNQFDNLMMMCISEYLRHGLIMPDTINLEARKLRDETCQEFIDFMVDLNIGHGQKFDKKELYNKFAEVNEDGKVMRRDFHWLKQRSFTKWLQLFATYRRDISAYREPQSNSKYYIQYFYNEPVPMDMRDGLIQLEGKQIDKLFLAIDSPAPVAFVPDEKFPV